jgi:hypothetical protein
VTAVATKSTNYTGTTNGYYVAPGVLYDDNTKDYITMAKDCVVYNIDSTAKTCVALTAEQLATITTVEDVCVAGTNNYGYATVVYFVDALS